MQTSKLILNTKQSKKLTDILVYSLLTITAVICLFPVIWMVAISIKPTSESVGGFNAILLSNPTLANFTTIFKIIPFFTQLYNSVFVTILGTATTVFFCALAGYGFAKFEFPARNFLFYLVIATMLVPVEVGVVPLFSIMKNLELINSL